jgi:hypothetical protein
MTTADLTLLFTGIDIGLAIGLLVAVLSTRRWKRVARIYERGVSDALQRIGAVSVAGGERQMERERG